jgi:hypothetical protein
MLADPLWVSTAALQKRSTATDLGETLLNQRKQSRGFGWLKQVMVKACGKSGIDVGCMPCAL